MTRGIFDDDLGDVLEDTSLEDDDYVQDKDDEGEEVEDPEFSDDNYEDVEEFEDVPDVTKALPEKYKKKGIKQIVITTVTGRVVLLK